MQWNPVDGLKVQLPGGIAPDITTFRGKRSPIALRGSEFTDCAPGLRNMTMNLPYRSGQAG